MVTDRSFNNPMQHDYHRCPVTALVFGGRHVLLAGEGNYLKAYDIRTANLLRAVQVFEDQTVHGILVAGDDETVLVWGGRHIRLLVGSELKAKGILSLGPLCSTDDWILHLAWAPSQGLEQQTAGILTAHNSLWYLQVGDPSSNTVEHQAQEVTLDRAVVGSNCILYSAHIQWLSASHCLIASGTAFGDVILWSAFFKAAKVTRSQVHFTYGAHEGSVFGVQISPMLNLPRRNEETRILATCSDDRTIRAWDISDLSTESPTFAQVQRDTGFGARSDVDAHAPPLLAKVMGHSSRIWHVRFLYDAAMPQDDHPKVLSCGEDAAANVWELRPRSADQPYELALISSRSPHSGKNIWSVAPHASGIVCTGGADGAVSILQELTHHGKISEMCRSLVQGEASSGKDNFKGYAFVASDTLVSTTEHGRVVLLDLSRKTAPVKELSIPVPGLRGYSIVSSLEGTAFISGADGGIWSYTHLSEPVDRQPASLTKLAQRNGKTAGLFVSRLDDRSSYLLATGVGSLSASLYSFPSGTAHHVPAETHLALPSGLIVTSFAMCEVNDVAYALVGSRIGSILIYNTAKSFDTELAVQPTYMRSLLHGKEAATMIFIEQCEHGVYVFSTGRDGMLAVQRLVVDSAGELSLKVVHQLSLPFGPNVEGLYVTPDDRRLITWGFRGKQFVQYDLREQQEVMNVECGGAHRNWAFRTASDGSGGTFVWTKASKVFRYSQIERTAAMLNVGGHGREIKAVAVSGKFGGKHGKEIVATGAEDTDIKLFHLCSKQHAQGFECLQTLRKHNTGIQHLAWEGDYLFSSGGFEEFFVWKVTHHVPCFEIGVVCESMHPRSGKSDLRICGFHVQRTRSTADGAASFDVWMAYSDSSLKLWRYTGSHDGSWELLRVGEYRTSCLTHVLQLQDRETGVVMTAATDGHLAFWPVEQEQSALTWRMRQKIHQSALHALASVVLADGSRLVVTGGDDNAIGLTRIAFSTARSVDVRTLLIPHAHAAAVTGLSLVRSSSPKADDFHLVSAGIDQRVKVWRITVDTSRAGIEGVDVEKVSDCYTAVADVSGLELCSVGNENGIVVCGVGIDVWRLSLDRDGGGTVEGSSGAGGDLVGLETGG